MVRFKQLTMVLCLLALLGAPCMAQTSLSQVFSECVGRFSAETEHAWLMGRDDAESFDAQRLTFLSLLDATLALDAAQQALSYRIEVKMAHASLLTLATFGRDTERAARARTLAAAHLFRCQRLLLDS